MTLFARIAGGVALAANAAGTIVVLFEDIDPGVGYWLTTRKGPLRPAARTFATWLRRQARLSDSM